MHARQSALELQLCCHTEAFVELTPRRAVSLRSAVAFLTSNNNGLLK